LPGGIRRQERNLQFDAGARAERPSGRHVVGQVAGIETGKPVVILLGQLEDQLLLAQRRDTAEEQRAVARHHQVHADAGSLSEQPGKNLGETADLELTQRRCEAFPTIEQHESMGQPLCFRHGRTLFPDVAEPCRGEQFLSPVQLSYQALEQPRRALSLRTGDDGATVRELSEWQERAVAAVNPVQMHVRCAMRQRKGTGDCAQQLRPP
jgi:hypothetical protein